MKADLEINRLTSQNHKKQFLLEILLPILISTFLLLLLFLLTVFSVTGKQAQDSRPVDIAIILIMAISLTLILISLVIILFLSSLLHKANQSLPQLLMNVQQSVSRISGQISLLAMVCSMPIIKIRSIIAAINNFFQSFRMKE